MHPVCGQRGIEDVATAAFAYEQAWRPGIGAKIDLEGFANDQLYPVGKR
jgi:hypothetical protein